MKKMNIAKEVEKDGAARCGLVLIPIHTAANDTMQDKKTQAQDFHLTQLTTIPLNRSSMPSEPHISNTNTPHFPSAPYFVVLTCNPHSPSPVTANRLAGEAAPHDQTSRVTASTRHRQAQQTARRA